MICTSPIQLAQRTVPCGQCMSCRINKKRKWAGRLALESIAHDPLSIFFFTLTYDDLNVPLTPGGKHTLDKDELQRYVKRVTQWARDNAQPVPRFFAAGEYGSKTERPHYHIIWYNLGTLVQQFAEDSWKKGFVSVSLVTSSSALSYTCAYTTKKMTGKNDERLEGREPEFMIASRKPAIGWPGIERIIRAYRSGNGKWLLDHGFDILTTFSAQGKSWPLEYRMAQHIRKVLGIPTKADERRPRPPYDPTAKQWRQNRAKLLREEQRAQKKTL